VRELEELALRLEVLVQQVHLGAGGEPLQLVLQRPEVQRERLGVDQRLAGDAGTEQPLRLADLVQVGEERGDERDDAEHGEADEHRTPQASVGFAPGR